MLFGNWTFFFFFLSFLLFSPPPGCPYLDESGCESDMAEGIEETESNSGSAAGDAKTSMLGAAIPCDIISPAIGSLKREFESYHSAIATSKTMSMSPVSASMSPHQTSHIHIHMVKSPT